MTSRSKNQQIASADGKHRYALYNRWRDDKSLLPIIALHPGTSPVGSDGSEMRVAKQLAYRLDAGGVFFCYLIPQRRPIQKLTWPSDAVRGKIGDVMGQALLGAAADDTPVICAWGDHAYAPALTLAVGAAAHVVGARLKCFGLTKNFQPRTLDGVDLLKDDMKDFLQ